MSTQPRPVAPVIGSEIRASARRGARSLSGGLLALFAGAMALLVVVGFVLLDYKFDQDAHRLVKIMAGMAAGLFVVLQPYLGLWLLPVAVPFLDWLPELPVPGLNTLNGLLLSVFGLWAISKILAREKIGRPANLGMPIAILLLGTVLSWVRGAAIPAGVAYDTLGAAIWVFRGAVVFAPYFITLMMLRGRKDRLWLAGAVVVGLVGESACTMFFGNWMKTRAMGSMAQPNVLGAFLNISTVITAALMLGQSKFWPRLLLFVAVVGGAYATILTISRGAMIALSLGFLYVSVRSSKLVTVVALVAIATSPLWAPAQVKERVMATEQQVEDSDDTQLEGSAQARLDTWNTTVEIAKKHLIDGVGFNGINYILRDTGQKLGLMHTKDSTHNTFLRVLAEMGIIGLGLFLYLLWRCWKLSLAGVRAARTRFDRQLAIGLGGATLAMIVNCWFGDRFFEFDIMCAYWMVCALVNDVVNRQHEEVA
jgi:O-antigen ligase